MIASLRGRCAEGEDPDGAVVDVGGVGYAVFCPARTLAALPPPGEPVELLVETHVREDHIHLYGFASAAERAWFRLLVKVQGVSPRMALGVLSALAPDALAAAIAAEDRAALRQVAGIGPRVAARILAELKDKGAAAAPVPIRGATAGAGGGSDGAGTDPVFGEAVSALVNLGYGRGEAHAAVARAGGGDLETRVRRGLAELSAP